MSITSSSGFNDWTSNCFHCRPIETFLLSYLLFSSWLATKRIIKIYNNYGNYKYNSSQHVLFLFCLSRGPSRVSNVNCFFLAQRTSCALDLWCIIVVKNSNSSRAIFPPRLSAKQDIFSPLKNINAPSPSLKLFFKLKLLNKAIFK